MGFNSRKETQGKAKVAADGEGSKRATPTKEFKALEDALRVKLVSVIQTINSQIPPDKDDVEDEIKRYSDRGELGVPLDEARKRIAADLTSDMTDTLLRGVVVPLSNIVDAQRHKSMVPKFRRVKVRPLERPDFHTEHLHLGGMIFAANSQDGSSVEIGRIQMDHLPYTSCAGAVDGNRQTRQVEFNPFDGSGDLSLGSWLKQRVFSILAKVDETQTQISGTHLGQPQPSGQVYCFDYSVLDLIRIVRNTMAAHADFVEQSSKAALTKRDLLLIASKEGPSYFNRYVNVLLLILGQEVLVAIRRSRGKSLDDDALAVFNCPIGYTRQGGRVESVPGLFVVSGAPRKEIQKLKANCAEYTRIIQGMKDIHTLTIAARAVPSDDGPVYGTIKTNGTVKPDVVAELLVAESGTNVGKGGTTKVAARKAWHDHKGWRFDLFEFDDGTGCFIQRDGTGDVVHAKGLDQTSYQMLATRGEFDVPGG